MQCRSRRPRVSINNRFPTQKSRDQAPHEDFRPCSLARTYYGCEQKARVQRVIAAWLQAPEVVKATAGGLNGKMHELAATGVEGRQLRQPSKARRKSSCIVSYTTNTSRRGNQSTGTRAILPFVCISCSFWQAAHLNGAPSSGEVSTRPTAGPGATQTSSSSASSPGHGARGSKTNTKRQPRQEERTVSRAVKVICGSSACILGLTQPCSVVPATTC